MSHLRCLNRTSLVLFGGFSCLLTHSAHAGLTLVPGMTEPQAAAAGAIQAVCPTLVANSATLNATQLDLRDICRAMVQTSNQQQGPGSGPTAFSLNLSVDELRQGLQSVASEETAVQGASAVDTGARGTTRAIGARLFQLHQGAAGFNLSSLNLNLNGLQLAGAQLRDRGGAAGADAAEGKLGGFLNGGYSKGNKDETSREDGFDFNSWGVVGGIDYRFSDNWVGGVALNYGESDSDITTFPGGNTDSQAWGASLYGTFYQSEAFYVDAHLNYTRNDFDTRRRIYVLSNNPAIPTVNRTAQGSTEGEQLTAGISAGLNIRHDALTITPYGRLEYLDLNIDGYTETGAIGLDLQVDEQSATSFQSALGVQLAYAVSAESGVYVPQLHLEWNHEFDNNSRPITARYVNDPFNLSTFSVPTNNPDKNFFTVGAGVSSVMRNGVSLFVDVQTVLGYRDLDLWGITAGARLQF